MTGPDAHDWYEYATGNMLLKDSSASYQYDANGNLVMMQGADWWVVYEHDYENRLTRVTDSGGMDVSYKYDPMGRRIEKDVLGKVTRYFYDGEDIAFEYSPGGTVGNVYVHGPGVDEPLGLVQTKGMYYYHVDGLGSIIGITDASSSLVQSYEYDSFGNLKDQKNRVKQPYAYTGREYDRETGLYYYRARYYMPEVGRFISADPVWSVNLYAYVENKPIGAVDPWGLEPGYPFLKPDTAAVTAIDLYIGVSNMENKEYGGFVYKITDELFSYTPAVRGTESHMKPSTFNQPPDGCMIVGIYHTHPGTGYNVPYFSYEDQFMAISYKSIFLGTSTGLVKRYSPWEGEKIIREPFVH